MLLSAPASCAVSTTATVTSVGCTRTTTSRAGVCRSTCSQPAASPELACRTQYNRLSPPTISSSSVSVNGFSNTATDSEPSAMSSAPACEMVSSESVHSTVASAGIRLDSTTGSVLSVLTAASDASFGAEDGALRGWCLCRLRTARPSRDRGA